MIPLPERRLMVEKHHHQLSQIAQCQLLEISRSGLYYTPSPESDENLTILRILDKLYLDVPFYGTEKLLAYVKMFGFHPNRKRLRRLMKIVNWRTIYPEKRTTFSDKVAYKYPYLLRNMEINRKNQVWAIDITYIPMEKGFMYLFAIIDIYSRYVVGWSLGNSMDTQWCIDCVNEAIILHGKPEIINSDQGSQFTSCDYITNLQNHKIQISMDGKGRAIDNIYIERLWRSVKYEHVYLFVYENGTDLWNGLHQYFHFYNTERLHQSLVYQTPEKQYYANIA